MPENLTIYQKATETNKTRNFSTQVTCQKYYEGGANRNYTPNSFNGRGFQKVEIEVLKVLQVYFLNGVTYDLIAIKVFVAATEQ